MKKPFYSNIANETLVCARCGYCRVDCPAYKILGWESSSPRAKIKIARDMVYNTALSKEQIERVYQCTLCGRCREECATDIDTIKLWTEIRREIANKKQNPANLQLLSQSIFETKNITGENPQSREIWLDSLDEGYRKDIMKPSKVLYFPGCTSSLFPVGYKIPQSMVQILRYANIDFSLLGQNEQCCGFPLICSGEFDKGQKLIEANVENMKSLGVDEIVTTCPSCYNTLKKNWPEVLGEELPFTISHASQFLNRIIDEGRIEFQEMKKRVVYHDPCDLGRNGGIYEEPRKVLKNIPGLELVEMESSRENSNCCGGGGSLESVDAGLSGSIANNRLSEVLEVDAEILVSSCQQCKRVFHSAIRKNKTRLTVLDLTEIVLKAVKNVEI
ncbi:MAG: (Fe-S)-binding protein [Clostridia bacterium]|nr:(Fe-S)-binding protein [Clostridia bacterium]